MVTNLQIFGRTGTRSATARLRARYMPRIILTEQSSDKALEVSELQAVIGRDPGCAFVVEGPNSRVVSGRHARIFFQDSGWWIEDTSRNGTILDDERLQIGQRHAIRVGQLIGLGDSGPRYRVTELESRRAPEAVGAGASEAPNAGSAARRSDALGAGRNSEERTEPSKPSPDWLVHVVLQATNTSEQHEVRGQSVTIGRSPECTIQIMPEQGASVSRTHAEIGIRDGGVMLFDLGSRNGTFLNGRRLEGAQPVVKNDLIMLGSGGPTFSVEDLHIVRASAANGPAKRPEFLASSPLARHTSYRAEPPTAPSRGHGQGAPMAAAPQTFVKPAVEDEDRSSRRLRIFIWVGIGALFAAAGALLLRGN